LARATKLFAWMIPGEARVFPRDELEQAKTWVARGVAGKTPASKEARQAQAVHLLAPLRGQISCAMRARHDRSRERWGMRDTLYVLGVSYDDVEDALAEYEAVEVAWRHVSSSHDFDATVVAKDETGKVQIVRRHDEPTRHGAATGLGWGLAWSGCSTVSSRENPSARSRPAAAPGRRWARWPVTPAER
jgi:hypothetical protein